MLQHVLIPVDGSPCGDQAAAVALSFCAQLHAKAHFLHVRNPGSQPQTAVGEHQWQTVDGGGLALLRLWEWAAITKGVRAIADSVEGTNVDETVVGVARDTACDLIALGTRYRGQLAEVLLGSTAHAVLRRASTPLMLVRHQPKTTHEMPLVQRILIPVDGSALSLHTLPWVRRVAQHLEASLVVLHVATPTSVQHGKAVLDEALGRLAYTKSQGVLETTNTSPTGSIIAQIADQHSDLVVTGTQGRSGWSRLLLGSVAESVVRQSRVPVILISPTMLNTHSAPD